MAAPRNGPDHSIQRNTTRDPTFRNYKADAAAAYLSYRPAYPAKLIEMVIEAHTSTNGKTTRLLDVGCGPGLATRQLAPYFEHVIGADPGESMISTARTLNIKSSIDEPARFEICSAETLDQIPGGVEPESIDLITAATAAHWFDLPQFYLSASKILKPGGSIIFWVTGTNYPDPITTPNVQEIQRIWDDFESNVIQAHELPGNKMSRELYEKIELPWTIIDIYSSSSKNDNDDDDEDDPAEKIQKFKSAMSQFDSTKSTRQTFNKDGIPDTRFEENGFLRYTRAKLEQLKMVLGTASQVTRWRETNRREIEMGEKEDCIEVLFRRTRLAFEVVGRGDVDEMGGGSAVGMIVIKKKEKEEEMEMEMEVGL